MKERMPSAETSAPDVRIQDSSPRLKEQSRQSSAELVVQRDAADEAFDQAMTEAQREISNLHYAIKLQEFGKSGDRQILDQLFMLSPETKMRLLKTQEEKKEISKNVLDAQLAEAQEEISAVKGDVLDAQLAEAQEEIAAVKAEEQRLNELFGPVPSEEMASEHTIILPGLRRPSKGKVA